MLYSLTAYGAKVDEVKAPLGEAVPLPALEEALQAKKYKLVTFTHVDTSTGMFFFSIIRLKVLRKKTGVLSDAQAIGATVKRVSPGTLVILDGVCSVASEEIHQEEWGIDVVLTATQKGLGTPPGLSIVNASSRAVQVSSQKKEFFL